MVQDVAYENMNLPGFVVTLALKFLSSQIEKKVHFDILKLKPIEFARECSVPCVFIIGAEDKLVYPKRVRQIFDAYLGKQKTLLTSTGDHSSEREENILQQCQSFLIQEFKRNATAPRPSIEPRRFFVDAVGGDQLKVMARAFSERIEVNILNSERKQRDRSSFNNTGRRFNFDVYLDETRNEENVLREGQDFDEQMLLDYRMQSKKKSSGSTKTGNLDDDTFSIRRFDGATDLGDITEAEFSENLKDLSMILRNNKF